MTHAFSVMAIVVLSALLWPATGTAAPEPEGWPLVRTPFPGPGQTTAWQAAGWDVWSVHPEQGVLMRLPPVEVQRLRSAGLAVEEVASPEQYAPRWYNCYRGYEEVAERLRELADDYPDVVELHDVGPTWETLNGGDGAERVLWAVRLTNRAVAGEKPKFFLVALHHAREIVTPEIALALIDRLMDGYGEDPTLSWLVDSTEIWVVPVANPDGHLKAQARKNWRKNVNLTACGGARVDDGNGPGVDLNRNYGYRWGGTGASPDPCNSLYRGDGPFSEPETQALRDFMEREQVDMVISLHSFSDLILYPWGHTDQPADDDADLKVIAEVFATYNRYEPKPSHKLYVATGGTCDWAYGELDAPCFTFEVGNDRDGYFWPTCAVMRRQVDDNLDALVHAVRLVRDPYGTARGPLADRVSVRYGADTAVVTASLDDARSGFDAIVAAELWIDEPGDYGAGRAMQVSGRGRGRGTATLELNLDEVPTGRRYVLVRARDDGDNWGPLAAGWFENGRAAPTPTATATPTPIEATPTPTPTATPTPTPEMGGLREGKLYLPLLVRRYRVPE